MKKKITRFLPIIFLNSSKSNSPWLRLTWTSEIHWGWNISAKFSHCVFPHSPIPTPSSLAALAGPTPSTPASPFLLLIFQRGQVCDVGTLTIDSHGLAPAQDCPITRLKPTSHLPRSALVLCPAVLWAALYMWWQEWLHAETGPNVIPQLLVPMHCPISLLAYHIQRDGLSHSAPYPAEFPTASTEIHQGMQPDFYGLNTLNFRWRKKQSRWCLDWEQLTFDVFWKHSLAKGH